MKSELSSLDIHFLVKEMQILIDGKIDKIYSENSNFLIQVHVPGKGKKLLKIMLPNFMYLTTYKQDYSHPDRFTMSLRKYLSNTRIRKIKQMGFDRIVEIKVEGKDGYNSLYIELFSPGNVILTRSDMSIIIAKTYKKFSERTIRGNVTYEYPEKDVNASTLYIDEISKALVNTNKESIVKALAIDLGFGGRYAEEICARAGIDKTTKKVTKKQAEHIYSVIKGMFEEKIDPRIYGDKDITPFPMVNYKDMECDEKKTFSEALDSVLTKRILEKKAEDLPSMKKRDKINKIIKSQNADIKKLKADAKKNQEKAEMIYKNYTTIEEILSQLHKAREKYSWKEIKEKTKNHKVLKQIHEKDGKLVLELN